MGRGRAKAKQTKVARELKYRPTGTDFASLEREMRGSEGDTGGGEIPDAYADLVEELDDADDGDTADDDDEGLRKSG